MLTVYVRLEPTTDSATAAMVRADRRWANPKQQRDAVIYRDRQCRQFFCRIPWHYSTRPTRRNKYITLNCYRWRLIWV